MIQRFINSLQNKGTKHTLLRVLNIIKQNISDLISGNRLYYSVHSYKISRYYLGCDVCSPIWISPHKISYLTGECDIRCDTHLDYTPYFKPKELDWSHDNYYMEIPYRHTIGGNWDSKSDKFEKLILFESAYDRYKNNVSWEQTKFFKRKVKRFIDEGHSQKSAKNIVGRECKNIDELYQAILNEGYSSQKQLGGHPLHEVTVNIARDGELLYNCEGRHRLVLAKIAGVEKIPVIILGVHKKHTGDIDL